MSFCLGDALGFLGGKLFRLRAGADVDAHDTSVDPLVAVVVTAPAAHVPHHPGRLPGFAPPEKRHDSASGRGGARAGDWWLGCAGGGYAGWAPRPVARTGRRPRRGAESNAARHLSNL